MNVPAPAQAGAGTAIGIDMIWYVCFFLTLLLLAAAIRVALHREYGELRIGVVLLLLLAAAYTIYAPVFMGEYDAAAAVLGGLLNTLRMITLDAGYLDYYSSITTQIHSGFFYQCYTVVLGLIHILLPAVSALAAYTILLRCFASFQLFLINWHKRELFVLSEWNEVSEDLARSTCRARGRKCDVVFANSREKPRGGSGSSLLRFVFHGDEITQLKIRRKREKDVYFFCISQQDDVNLNDALHLIHTYSKMDSRIQKRTHICLRSSSPDCDTIIDSAEKQQLDVRIFNESEEVAYQLLQTHPLYRSADRGKIRMVLVGMGEVNQALLRAAVWCGQMDGYELEIHVTGTDVAEKQADFLARFPALAPGGRYQIAFHPCRNMLELEQILREKVPAATYIVVQSGNDDENMEIGLQLRRLYYLWDPTYRHRPDIFVHCQAADKFRIISQLRTSDNKDERRVSYQLTPFGKVDSVYSYENLVDSPLEGLAKNVHLVYSDIFSDGNLDLTSALEQYNLLEVKKRSNRANAMHIRYKLALLGLDYTDDPDAVEVDLDDYLDSARLAKLTYAEHDRWMAFLESEGWQTSDISQVQAYQAAGLSPKRHESAILKLHPFICDFHELPARSEALHQKDSTIYDEQLIARIPDILHDRWGVSHHVYKIIRK